MDPDIYLLMIVTGVVGLLALPAFPSIGSDWPRFFRALLVVLVGVMLPWALFLIDVVFGTPEWKGGCRCGWVSGSTSASSR